MIPEAAVEAAARAIFEHCSSDWDILPERTKRQYLRDARVKLEAAAPHMHTGAISAEEIGAVVDMLKAAKADAWDEGNIAGTFDLPSADHTTPNPYRSTK